MSYSIGILAELPTPDNDSYINLASIGSDLYAVSAGNINSYENPSGMLVKFSSGSWSIIGGTYSFPSTWDGQVVPRPEISVCGSDIYACLYDTFYTNIEIDEESETVAVGEPIFKWSGTEWVSTEVFANYFGGLGVSKRGCGFGDSIYYWFTISEGFGRLIKYNGSFWSDASSDQSLTIYGMVVFSGDLYAIGSQGVLYKLIDGSLVSVTDACIDSYLDGRTYGDGLYVMGGSIYYANGTPGGTSNPDSLGLGALFVWNGTDAWESLSPYVIGESHGHYSLGSFDGQLFSVRFPSFPSPNLFRFVDLTSEIVVDTVDSGWFLIQIITVGVVTYAYGNKISSHPTLYQITGTGDEIPPITINNDVEVLYPIVPIHSVDVVVNQADSMLHKRLQLIADQVYDTVGFRVRRNSFDAFMAGIEGNVATIVALTIPGVYLFGKNFQTCNVRVITYSGTFIEEENLWRVNVTFQFVEGVS